MENVGLKWYDILLVVVFTATFLPICLSICLDVGVLSGVIYLLMGAPTRRIEIQN